jgi:transcription factor E
MQIKLLQNLVEELAGVDTGRIVDILFNKKDVNEFLIAKKMELTINQVRNILYKLSADGLVTFIRKKDKRKGWYIYYWTLKTEKCLVKLEQSLIKKITDLKALLQSRETKRFYICKTCDIEVSEESALEHGFTCEECADVYELQDNSKSIREAKAQILRRERELKLIGEELKEVREKEAKKKARRDKKEEKEREIEKAKKRKEQQRLRKLKKLLEEPKKKVKKPKSKKKVKKKPKAKKKVKKKGKKKSSKKKK